MKQNVTDYNYFYLFFKNAFPQKVIKAVKGFEPEWVFGVMFIMILMAGKCRPAIANIFAARLKEYHNCYNTIECQFFIYFRKTPLAIKMAPGCKDVWVGRVNFERHGVYLI